MMKDSRILKMYGLFFNSGSAAAMQHSILTTFFCLILKDETVQEQLRISSLILIVYGLGAILGG